MYKKHIAITSVLIGQHVDYVTPGYYLLKGLERPLLEVSKKRKEELTFSVQELVATNKVSL